VTFVSIKLNLKSELTIFMYLKHFWIWIQKAFLKGYFTSGKMNVYLKWVIYVEEIFEFAAF